MRNKLAKSLAVLTAATLVIGGFVLNDGQSDNNAATPTDLDPVYSSVTVHKQLVGDIWHVRCDYMDGTDFHAGGGLWKRDLISNPEGELPREGHRSNKCGDADNWVIWVGTDGTPYRMDEIKSGATGGTLPTVIYRPRYDLTTEEIINMSVGDTDLIWRYSQNFIDVMDWSDIEIGQRMYWTTSSSGRVWYHTGIPYKSTPTFILFVDGVGYPLVAGGSVEIEDLLPGIHEITEMANANYYLGEVTSSGDVNSQNEWTVTIDISGGENVSVNWPNVVLTPKPTTSPKPPNPPVVVTPTPTPTPEPTATTTPAPTETPTPEPTETPTPEPTVTPVITEEPSPTPEITATHTPEITPAPTVEVTATPTPAPTLTPTVKPTPSPTIRVTPSPTPSPTLIPTEHPTPTPDITEVPEPTPTVTPTPEPTATPEPTPVVIVDVPIPEVPEGYKQPKTPHGMFEMIDDYLTALGIQVRINHVGDCFD